MTKQPAVYILASKRNGTLYVGVTAIFKATWTHKNDLVEGFTKRYSIHFLVYYELHREGFRDNKRETNQVESVWKLELIEENNPDWKDLWEEIV